MDFNCLFVCFKRKNLNNILEVLENYFFKDWVPTQYLLSYFNGKRCWCNEKRNIYGLCVDKLCILKAKSSWFESSVNEESGLNLKRLAETFKKKLFERFLKCLMRKSDCEKYINTTLLKLKTNNFFWKIHKVACKSFDDKRNYINNAESVP